MGVTCCKQTEEEIEIKIPCDRLYVKSKDMLALNENKNKRALDSLNFSLCIYNKKGCACKFACTPQTKKTIDSGTEFESKTTATLCISKKNYQRTNYDSFGFTEAKIKISSIIKLQSYFRGIFYRRRFIPLINLIVKKRSISVPPIKIPQSTKNNESKPNYCLNNGMADHRKQSSSSNGNKDELLAQDNNRRRLCKLEVDASKTYSGEIVNSKKDGFGVLIWQDGSKYIGAFKDNVASGVGQQIHKNGDSYFGKWLQGRAEGFGYYINKSGSKYEGEWKNDKQNGFGIEAWGELSNAVYEGDYLNGYKHGFGKLHLHDGSIYEGEFHENFISGVGKLIYKDNKIYLGSWRQNKMNGFGILSWNDGKHFEGNFIQDSKEGFGVYWCCKKVYIGVWQKNKLEGEVCIAEGSLIKNSLWKEGKKVKYLESKSKYLLGEDELPQPSFISFM